MGNQTEFEAVPNLVLIEGDSVSETFFFPGNLTGVLPRLVLIQVHFVSCTLSRPFLLRWFFVLSSLWVISSVTVFLTDWASLSFFVLFCFLSCGNPELNCLSDNYMDEKRPG